MKMERPPHPSLFYETLQEFRRNAAGNELLLLFLFFILISSLSNDVGNIFEPSSVITSGIFALQILTLCGCISGKLCLRLS